MTDNQLRERSLINMMSLLIWHLTQGSISAGDKDQVIDCIIQLTRLLNEYKLEHKIEITDNDLWED